MRNAFFQTLMDLAERDERISLVVGDLGFSVVEPFAERFPSRYVNAGVAEQNMTGIAAGMALGGKVVFTYSIANFPTLRCVEQIRNDICYHKANVKIVAVGGGMAYGALGFTHYGTEDLAIMRALPGMVVVSSGDPIEVELATRAIVEQPGPCYLRLGRAGEPMIHQKDVNFQLGKAIKVREGYDLTLISTGAMLHTTLQVAEHLAQRGVQARVLSMHTIQPLDSEGVLSAAQETAALITIEEHSVIGGLGSAVAEVLAELGLPSRVLFKRVGLPPRLPSVVGSPEYLRGMGSLTVDGVLNCIKPLLDPLLLPKRSPSRELVEEIPMRLLRAMYVTMLRIRRFEEQVADLDEAGEIKTPCHLYIGQEAIATGVCAALQRKDYVWGGHRSHGHYLAKGGDLRAMMAELYGKSTGCSKGRGGSMHLVGPGVGFPGTVPLVAATIPLAVGAGLASKMRGDDQVSVSFFGDGATEEGHFHESVNLAAVYRLPVLFVCENNFYSSHMHLLERRAEDNIYKLGEAHGIPGIRLDGNDVTAVYQATVEAIRRARTGDGPTLLECRTYRWRGHVGPSWDMDVGVKRRDELKDWLPKDPVARTRARLLKLGVRQEEFDQIEKEIRAEVEEAVVFARKSPYPDESELCAHVFHSEEERQ